MSKFHIKKDGTVAQCKATKGSCPYGENRHFDSEEMANRVSQLMMEEKHKILGDDRQNKEAVNNREREREKKALETAEKRRARVSARRTYGEGHRGSGCGSSSGCGC